MVHILGYCTKNQTQMQMLRSTVCRNEEVALHRSVMSLLIDPARTGPELRPHLLV